MSLLITGDLVYFTESSRKFVGACSVLTRECVVVLRDGIDKPRGVALFPEEGLLFYADWGS